MLPKLPMTFDPKEMASKMTSDYCDSVFHVPWSVCNQKLPDKCRQYELNVYAGRSNIYIYYPRISHLQQRVWLSSEPIKFETSLAYLRNYHICNNNRKSGLPQNLSHLQQVRLTSETITFVATSLAILKNYHIFNKSGFPQNLSHLPQFWLTSVLLRRLTLKHNVYLLR